MTNTKAAEKLASLNEKRTRLQILVVDDNADCAESTAMLLRLNDHEVEVAGDGWTALRAVQDRPPDVVLLDIGLPGMDGWKVAEQIQEMAGREKRLVIAITGFGQATDLRHSLKSGIDLHLVKPVDPK